MIGLLDGLSTSSAGPVGGAARLRHAAAKIKLQQCSDRRASAKTLLDELREQRQQRLKAVAETVGKRSTSDFSSADFDSIRALSKLRAPPPVASLVARCACTLLTVDLPGFKVPDRLLKWEDAKKILFRGDLPYCLSRFDMGKLAAHPAIAATVKSHASWHGDGSASGEGAPTLEQARASSSAAGLLFAWCARVLVGLDEVVEAARPTPDGEAAQAAATAEMAAADEALRATSRDEAKIRVEAEAEAKAEEEARLAAEAKKRAEAEARRKAEEKRRREEEEARRRAAEEAAQQEAARLAAEEARRKEEEAAEEARRKAEKAAEEARRKAEKAAEDARRKEEEAAEEARRKAELAVIEARKKEEERLAAEARAEAEREIQARREAIAKHEADAAAAEVELRRIEATLAETEAEARRAEAREAESARIAAARDAERRADQERDWHADVERKGLMWARYLSSQSGELESAIGAIGVTSFLDDEFPGWSHPARDPAEQRRRGDAAMSEDELLSEVAGGAVRDLMEMLTPRAVDAAACRAALERNGFDFDAAACDLLVELG